MKEDLQMNPVVSSLYNDYIWKGENAALAMDLYGDPPVTMGQFVERVEGILQGYQRIDWHGTHRLNLLKSTLIDINGKLGCLTPRVRESIENLENGAVEAAHQSVVMGGPSYILNKAATAKRLASMSNVEDSPLVSFFFVADYDVVQAELTNIRTPIMGHGGNLISIPVPEGYENAPVSVLPLPDYGWYDEVEERIRASYNPMFKSIEGRGRLLFEERLEVALAVTRWAFNNSGTLGDFAQRIIGRLLNVEGKLGMPILPASDPGVRELMATGLEVLLAEKNRTVFLEVHNRVTDLIVEAGFTPGAGRRRADFVPFFYECPGEGCHNGRTELHYEIQGNQSILTGTCASCGEKVQIEVSTTDPDLSEVSKMISPRVDTRQFAIDTALPVVGHVGGAGETAYYAQVIPIARELSLPFPTFVKYPRVYFNTPWNESLAKRLQEKEISTFHSPEMFRLSGRISRFRKKNRHDEMNEELLKFSSFLLENHSKLNSEVESIVKKREDAGKEDKEEMQMLRLDLERYLSWTFGQYAKGKMGQESAWSWIEWLLNAGAPDLFGPYQRGYVAPMKNGATLFVNFLA